MRERITPEQALDAIVKAYAPEYPQGFRQDYEHKQRLALLMVAHAFKGEPMADLVNEYFSARACAFQQRDDYLDHIEAMRGAIYDMESELQNEFEAEAA